MPDSMIERMARALFDSGCRPAADVSPASASWEDLATVERAMYLDEARGVLTAMRDPTEAMIAAEAKDVDGEIAPVNSYEVFTPTEIWRSMIDAALSER